MKTEEQIREMEEILRKEVDLSMRQGKTIKDVEMQNLHSMLGMIHLILDDERTLIYSEDYKNLYWFINLHKNRFVISSTVDNSELGASHHEYKRLHQYPLSAPTIAQYPSSRDQK